MVLLRAGTGAANVGITTIRSKRDKPATGVARGAATYPLSARSRISRACASGTSVNCSVRGPPGARSPFTIVVLADLCPLGQNLPERRVFRDERHLAIVKSDLDFGVRGRVRRRRRRPPLTKRSQELFGPASTISSIRLFLREVPS